MELDIRIKSPEPFILGESWVTVEETCTWSGIQIAVLVTYACMYGSKYARFTGIVAAHRAIPDAKPMETMGLINIGLKRK